MKPVIPFGASGAFRPVAAHNQLRRLAVRGAAATVSAAGLSLGVQVISTVVLARLLTPSDFGVVAMVTTFSMLVASFGLSGFSEAVIQPEELNRFQASNLFWVTCGIGLTLMIGFAMSASLLARFYRNSLVAPIAVALAVSIFIGGLPTIHIALLKRAMRFSAVSANDLVARAFNTAVTVLMALRGWGYWALVAGIFAQVISLSVGALWLCRWIPSLPRRGVGTRALLKFAASVYGRFTANYFVHNFDNLLVGWRFSATALGFYKKAYDLFALSASQLTAPLHSVALAALSRLSQEPARLRRYLANSLGILAFLGMGLGATLTLVGQAVVRLVLGPGWSESGRIFELFGPGIGAMLLYNTVGWIHLSIGKPGRWLRWTLIDSTATVLLFILALPWGPAGIAVAWSVCFWILLIPAFWYAGRPIQFGAPQFMAAVWKFVVAALMAGGLTAVSIRRLAFSAMPASSSAALEEIILVSVMFLILYLSAVVVLHRGFAPLRQLGSLLVELAPVRRTPVLELATKKS